MFNSEDRAPGHLFLQQASCFASLVTALCACVTKDSTECACAQYPIVWLIGHVEWTCMQESFSHLSEADREQLVALLPLPDREDPMKALTTPQVSVG